MIRTACLPAALLIPLFMAGCLGPAPPATTETQPSPAASAPGASSATELALVAESDRRWTGVAASQEGRIFVNYPRWTEDVPVSVAEVTGLREVHPYPDADWNRWEPSLDPGEHFVCVQSVVVDEMNHLWVLDPANPRFEGALPGGPKLVRIDLATDEVVQVIRFGPDVAPADSYLNDVRIDTPRQIAYITDSGTGALLVVTLETGRTRRLLADHPSTASEGTPIIIDGRRWLLNGEAPDIHADGIALSPDREHLYYHALTGRNLYRIATRWLRDEYLPDGALGDKVQTVGDTGPVDGMLCDPEGAVYLTALEEQAIRQWSPTGELETVVRDARLQWPDSMALTPEGGLLVTTSQIHFWSDPPEPFRIFRVPVRSEAP